MPTALLSRPFSSFLGRIQYRCASPFIESARRAAGLRVVRNSLTGKKEKHLLGGGYFFLYRLLYVGIRQSMDNYSINFQIGRRTNEPQITHWLF